MAVIFCDSSCDLSKELINEYDIKVIKMPYTLNDKGYFFDLSNEFDYEYFYGELRQGKLAATSALGKENYIEYFEPYFAAGQDILYVGFSRALSATFDYMDLAVQELRQKYPEVNFYHFDTANMSMAAGLQVLHAAKLFESGKTLSQIVDVLSQLSRDITVEFVVDDLKHLKRGGRISGAQAALGTILNYKPILKVDENGRLKNTVKVMGKNKAITYLANQATENRKEFVGFPIVILHADSECDAFKVKEKIVCGYVKDYPDIWIMPLGPIAGAHCGPGTLAVVYLENL